MQAAISPWGWVALLGVFALVLRADKAEFPDRWALARQLHPQVQVRFLALLRAIEALGYTVELTSAYRAGGNDYHGFGLALDVNLVHKATGQRYGMKVGRTSKADWEATGVPALIRKLGYRWGGDFVTPWMGLDGQMHAAYDPVHIDEGKRYNINVLRTTVLKLAGSAAQAVNYDRRKVPLAA